MSLPDSLFQQDAIATEPELPCWLWLVELVSGRVVQMACSPAAERGQAERFAQASQGAALVRVVPVPGADRLLRPAEIRWSLAGRGLVSVEGMPPARWLARVAWMLECSPEQLTASDRLTSDDAAQCSAAAPHLAAELIRSHGWAPPPPAEPGPRQAPPTLPSAPSFSATWCAARDAYLGHLMACPDCIAHRLRNPVHCEAGAALRRTYEAASDT